MNSKLLPWSDYVDLLKPAGDLISLAVDPNSEQLRANLYRQFMMNASLGYFMYFQSDPDHPDWTPFLNSVFLLQPNPDDVYLFAHVGRDRVYRVSGDRGSVHLLTINTGAGMMGMAEPNMAETRGKAGRFYDVDDLQLGPNGEVEIIFSAERPENYEGNWLELPPEADFLLVRQRSYDWGKEREARLAIECLGNSSLKPHLSVEQTDERIREVLEGFVMRLSRMWLHYQKDVVSRGIINRIEFSYMGYSIPPQVYWQGMFEFDADEALILETPIPENQCYWNVQLNDELWNAVEFVYRQSSLNGAQAKLDSDGKFRAVISHQDPGVHNWLDPAGAETGMLIGRWYTADGSSATDGDWPVPTLTKVPLKDLHKHLPRDTAFLTPEARTAQLRARQVGAQLRRRW